MGRPEAVKLTVPLKPFAAATLILEAAALPPMGVDNVFEAQESVKLGVGTVRMMLAELVILPTTPVIFTA